MHVELELAVALGRQRHLRVGPADEADPVAAGSDVGNRWAVLVAHGFGVQRRRREVITAQDAGLLDVEVGEGGWQGSLETGAGDAAAMAGGRNGGAQGQYGDQGDESDKGDAAHGVQPPVISRRRSRTKAMASEATHQIPLTSTPSTSGPENCG